MEETYFDILRRYWGYPVFRGQQESIIVAILSGKDVLAFLPTGSGKSICYQLPALMRPGLTLVISPLIALMENQVTQCKQRGIPAGALHGGMEYRSQQTVLDQAEHGRIKLLYIAPERLNQDRFLEFLSNIPELYVMVDEAHCISQWGHDFRPAYLQINRIKASRPEVQIAAFTATATPEVGEDISSQLELKDPVVFRESVAKSNLQLIVNKETNKWSEMLDRIQAITGTQIVYVRSRNRAESVSRYLIQRGIKSKAYHAGMPYEQRMQTQNDWISGKTRIIVATTAFGMGIDKADVRQVIHLDIPETLEEYIQEAGRAGRDGAQATAVLLFQDEDIEKNIEHLRDQFPDFTFIRKVYKMIGQYLDVAVGGGDEMKPVDWVGFSVQYQVPLRPLMTAVRILEMNGYIIQLDSWYKPASVQFRIQKESLYDLELPGELMDVLQVLMRTYEGIFLFPQRISEGKLAGLLSRPKEEVVQALQLLEKMEVISYQPSTDLPMIAIAGERLPAQDLIFDRAGYQQLVDRKYQQWNAMYGYVTLESGACREQAIGNYFNEKLPHCGRCDLCRELLVSIPQKEVWSRLLKAGWSLPEFVKSFSEDHRNQVLDHLTHMESEHLIWIDGDRNIHINEQA
ncbi:MAG: RecQ family ATP-dependent DNA helicase [Saprospiraceae bacterium]|nr:RecQ family ATP-dependent DNA helicase [Saprospiraceae bacterium]MCB9318886.1 RecQ family ATP-dependent DNA helicase [Lewinellaceae bacterium]